jgi:hypothetical protein
MASRTIQFDEYRHKIGIDGTLHHVRSERHDSIIHICAIYVGVTDDYMIHVYRKGIMIDELVVSIRNIEDWYYQLHRMMCIYSTDPLV